MQVQQQCLILEEYNSSGIAGLGQTGPTGVTGPTGPTGQIGLDGNGSVWNFDFYIRICNRYIKRIFLKTG